MSLTASWLGGEHIASLSDGKNLSLPGKYLFFHFLITSLFGKKGIELKEIA